jgi:hypothetical protein
MQALTLFHKNLRQACPFIHAQRLGALIAGTQALLDGRELTVTRLGRSLQSKAKTKNNIKRIDRLVSNPHLQCERPAIYAAHARLVLGSHQRPIVLVDWSDLNRVRDQLLRASVSVKGRSFTLYEEVHPITDYDNPTVCQTFLQNLREVLPSGLKPIIVTDAGFRGPWFQKVLALGWDFIGRVRNRTLYQPQGCDTWEPCKALYSKASATPKTLGPVLLNRSQPLACEFYLFKEPAKARQKVTEQGQRCRSSHSEKCARAAREPWLLASSLQEPGARIVKLYAQRMQIEESFRDSKSASYGFGLSMARTTCRKRLEVLLLLALCALWVLWLTGKAAEQAKAHYQFQANSIKTRPVLSTVFIGWQVLLRGTMQFDLRQLMGALAELQLLVRLAWEG